MTVLPAANASLPQAVADPVRQSVRTLCGGIPCPGCHIHFHPSRPNQRHCKAACRKLAQRRADAARLAAVLERLNPLDPGHAE